MLITLIITVFPFYARRQAGHAGTKSVFATVLSTKLVMWSCLKSFALRSFYAKSAKSRAIRILHNRIQLRKLLFIIITLFLGAILMFLGIDHVFFLGRLVYSLQSCIASRPVAPSSGQNP